MCFELYLRLAALFEVTKAVTAAQGRVCVNFAGCWQQSCCGDVPLLLRSWLSQSPLADVGEGHRWGNE